MKFMPRWRMRGPQRRKGHLSPAGRMLRARRVRALLERRTERPSALVRARMLRDPLPF